MTTNIKKSTGQVVPYSSARLRESLRRSGASVEHTEAILFEIEKQIYEGMSTKDIYRQAFRMLKGFSKPLAAKYKLKNALLELGPTGFPFERFVAEILKNQGFFVKVGEIVNGHCVNHEIDVIALKGDKKYMVECKFHNHPGINCDVKIPLYIQSRFKDVERKWKELSRNEDMFHQGWVVTNTRFTSDAIQYGLCAKLHLLGWDFPYGNGLREQIDASGLYPITCLTTMTKSEKQKLLDKNVVLCRDINSNPELLNLAFVSGNRRKVIMSEVVSICVKASGQVKN